MTAAPAPTTTVLAPPVRVVIVDDQAPFRRVARAVVGRTPGFAVVADGDSGEEAVRLCEELHPDLLLIDVQMPGMGGVEAALRVRAAGWSLVVLVSTQSRDDLDLVDPATGEELLFLPKESLTPARLAELWEQLSHPAAPA